jgi:hypothetical protein
MLFQLLCMEQVGSQLWIVVATFSLDMLDDQLGIHEFHVWFTINTFLWFCLLIYIVNYDCVIILSLMFAMMTENFIFSTDIQSILT